jgi:signal transduction histidine kinase/PAS domain-containing protein
MGLQGQVNASPALAGAQVAFVCDDGGSVLEASDAIRSLLGRALSELRGQHLARLALPEDEDAVVRGLAAAQRSGSSSFSLRLRPRDGAPVETNVTAWGVDAPGGRLTICVAAPSRDRGPDAEERARRLADTQRVIATILDLALQNLPVDDLLRRTLDLILEIPWLSIERKGAIFLVEQDPGGLVLKVHRGLHESLLSSCARVEFGTCLCGQSAMHRKAVYAADVDERHTTRYLAIVPHGHYCVPIVSDDATLGVITTYLAPGHERSEFELEFLQAVANTLAGVLVRRRVDAERQRAECASRAKSEFLALVSHELLTPVTAAMLSCQRLERDRDDPVAPRHADILCRMEASLARLASTIRLLLEHARLDAAGPSVHGEPVNLAELATEVLDDVRSVAHRKGLTLSLTIEPPLPLLHTDGRLLKVVLANLASNAIKFTEVGVVTVRVRYADGAHSVAIEDTGPGIPASERRRLFETFTPLEPLANKHVPGMGLGLALANRLALALGARLDLEPARGGGSTFVVTLPATGAGSGAALH